MELSIGEARILTLESDGYTRIDYQQRRKWFDIFGLLVVLVVFSYFFALTLFEIARSDNIDFQDGIVALLAVYVFMVLFASLFGGILLWYLLCSETLWVAPGKFARSLHFLKLNLVKNYDFYALGTFRFVPARRVWYMNRGHADAYVSFPYARRKTVKVLKGVDEGQAWEILQTLDHVGGLNVEMPA